MESGADEYPGLVLSRRPTWVWYAVTPATELETITNGHSVFLVEAGQRLEPIPVGGSLKLVVMLADVLAGVVAVWAAVFLGTFAGVPWPGARPLCLAAGLSVACWVLGLMSGRLYTFRPTRGALMWAFQVAVCLGGGTLAVVALSFLFSNVPLLDRGHYLLATALVWPLALAWRLLVVRYGPAPLVRERVLIVGTDTRARWLVTNVQEAGNPLGADLVGAVRVGTDPVTADFPIPVLGELSECPRLAREHLANTLVVAPMLPLPDDVMHCAAHCDAMGLGVWTWETAFEELTRRAPVSHIGQAWQATLESPPRSRYASRLKRCADVALVLILMPLALAIIGSCALLTKLTSRGPVFYRQDRVGKDGRVFSFLKLRTMVVDAEKETGPVWATAADPRATPFGRFLRKCRLDELPQVFLVLSGDMSIIGPRPERPFFVQQFMEEIPLYEKRLMVRPGITGWAQIHHNYDRTTDDVIEKLRYDLYYIRHLSFSLDLQIVLKTLGVMLSTKGAH
jgi:exopolysaccharide biosynthesis polyprenyl glycosylphosphotransferase